MAVTSSQQTAPMMSLPSFYGEIKYLFPFI